MTRHAKNRTAALGHGHSCMGARKARKAGDLQRRKDAHNCQSSSSTWLLLVSVAGTTLWATHPAYGQALYWGGAGTPAGAATPVDTGTWAAGSGQLNWSSDSSGLGGGTFTDTTTTSNDLFFNAGNQAGDYTVTVSGTQAAGNITFAAAGNVTLSGGTISLASGETITNTSGELATFGASFDNSSGGSFNVAGNSSITFNTLAHVTVTVNTTGGITTFGGTDDNNSMGLVVNGGIVSAAKASNSNTHIEGNGLTINTGGTVQINGNPTSGTIDQQFYQGSNVIINGGTLDLNGRNEGMPQLNGSSTGIITNTSNSLATLTLGEGDGGQYNGQIIDGMGGVAVAHIGTGTSTLNGVNTFTQGLTILSGSIRFGLYNSLGNGSITLGDATNTGLSATLIADGGINNAQFAADITNPIFATGNGANEITTIGFSPTFSGPIVLNDSNLILNSNNGGSSTLTASGGVTGNGSLILQVMTANTGSAVQLNGSNAINNNGTITNNGTGNGTATINANIGSNVTNVIQSAANSQLTLTGSNTFGGLTILAGNVNLNSNGAAGSGSITIGDATNTGLAASLITQQGTTFANPIIGTGNGTNTIFATNFQNTFSGNVSLNNGNLVLTTVGSNGNSWSNMTFSGPVSGTGNIVFANLNAGGGGQANAGTTLSNSVNNSGTITNTGNNTGTDTISGNIGGNVANVIENSATSPLNLTGSNANSALTINAGTVIFNTAAALGSGNVTLGDTNNTGAAATLNANGSGANNGAGGGFGANIANPILSTGTGTNTIAVTSWNPTFSGPITLNNDLQIVSSNTGGSDVFITGGVTGTGNLSLESNANSGAPSNIVLSTGAINNSGSVTNSGSGSGNVNTTISASIGSNVTGVIQNSATSALTLSGSNTYSGPTIVSAGTLNAGIASMANVSGAFGNNSALVLSSDPSAAVNLNGFNTQVGSITGGGTTGGNVNLGSATLTTGGDGTSPAPYAGTISGSGGVTKIGGGTQIFTNTNSSYTGSTTVSGGTLDIQNATSLFNASNGNTLAESISIANGSVLELDETNPSGEWALGTSGGITITGSGTLQLNQTGSGTSAGVIALGDQGGGRNVNVDMTGGIIDIEGGTLRNGGYSGGIWAGNGASMNIAAGATLDLWDGNAVIVDGLTGNGTVTHTSYGGSTNLTVGVNNDINGPATFAGSFVETDGHTISLTKVGTGVQVLTGAADYTAGTTVSGGTLIFVNNQSGSANYTDNATLEFDVTTGTQQLNGGTISGNGTLNIIGGGTVLLGANGSSENVSLSSGGLIDVSGAGTLLRNEYSNGNWAQNQASLEVDSGATVNLWDSPGGITVDALNGSGTVTHTSYGGTENLTVGIAGGSGTFSGTIADVPGNPLALVKAGAGTQILTGANSYSAGTSVNGGTLLVNNTTGSGTGSGTVAVNSGGTLGGAGSIAGSVTLAAGTTNGSPGVLANGGAITAGAGSTTVGTLTTGNQTWNGQANLIAKVNGITGSGNTVATAGIDNDLVTTAGSITLANGNTTAFNVQLLAPAAGVTNFNPLSSYTFEIASFGSFVAPAGFSYDPSNTTILATDGGAGAPAVTPGDAGFFTLDTSSFASASSNATSTSTSSFALELISTGGGAGQLDVVYFATPEPGTAMLLLAGAGPMLMARRRKARVK